MACPLGSEAGPQPTVIVPRPVIIAPPLPGVEASPGSATDSTIRAGAEARATVDAGKHRHRCLANPSPHRFPFLIWPRISPPGQRVEWTLT